MTINIALLGGGRIGQVHAKAIQAAEGAALYSISDAIESVAQSTAERLGCKALSLDEAVRSAEVDAVIIATPTDTHAELIEQCTLAGKAVFCEKPIDLSDERVQACLKIVEANKGRLMVGFNRRFDPHFMAVKAQLETGAIGDIEQIQITSRDPSPPPAEYIARSGGIFRDMMIHDFDMARFLLGEEVTEVSAVGSVLVDPDIGKAGDYDTAMATLKTASGKQCVITNSRRATYGYDQRVEVHGSKGMVMADNPKLDSVEVAVEAGYSRAPLHNFFMTRYTEAYVNEISQFVRWLSDQSVNIPTGTDGLKALQLADAALRSVQTGKTQQV